MPELLRSEIERSVQNLREKAFVEYGVDINPAITFNVRGMKAATAAFEAQVLDFNLHLGLNNREVFIHEIAGHEFIHLLADALHGHQDHGKQWKQLMVQFGYKPDLEYKLDTTGLVTRKEKLYIYECDCNRRFYPKETHVKLQRKVLNCPDCLGTAKCINDRASDLQRLRPGTVGFEVSQLLVSYAELEVPPNHAILLLQDAYNLSYGTARSYFYRYRPHI